MRDIPFVDAHVHLWDLALLRYPWLTPPFGDDGPNGNVEAIARTYLPADYRADSAGWTVAGYVHIDAGVDAGQAIDEVEWLSALDDGPSGIVAFAALDDPDVERLLAAHAAQPKVRGIRQIVNWHTDPRRTYTPRDVTGDAAWARGFALLGKYGLSFDLQAYAHQFEGLARLIGRHPDVPVMMNHAGMPVDTDEAGQALWRTGMRRLAELPNVAVKVSGLGFVHRPPTAERIRGHVLAVIDMFGTDRTMFASDVPTDTLFAPCDATLAALAACIADFSEDERRAMWGRNADRLYRLGLGV